MLTLDRAVDYDTGYISERHALFIVLLAPVERHGTL